MEYKSASSALTIRCLEDIVELNKDSPYTRESDSFLTAGTLEQTEGFRITHLDRSDFICAYSGSELIGLLKLVYANETASILTFSPKASHVR